MDGVAANQHREFKREKWFGWVDVGGLFSLGHAEFGVAL